MVAWLQDLVKSRPAESTTAAAGAIGLLISVFVGNGNNDFQTALIVVLSLLPAIVSRLYDLGRFGADGRRVPRDVNRELEQFALRTVRRARRRHPYWQRDVEALQRMAEVRSQLLPPERPAPTGGPNLGPAPGAEKQTQQ